MSREVYGIEYGFAIYDTNTTTGVYLIQGSGAPGGDTGIQDEAPIGSRYFDRANGQNYTKFANAGAAADWVLEGKLSTGLDTATNGNIATGDSLESALGKIFANAVDLQTASGIAQGDVNFGTFAGNILPDNRTAKQLFQDLESYIEQNLAEDISQDNVTTETVLDDEIVDDVLAVEYDVVISSSADGSNREVLKILVSHNGTAGADATVVKETVTSKLKFGSGVSYSLDTALNGVGAAQVMQLKITASPAVDVRARKIAIVKA